MSGTRRLACVRRGAAWECEADLSECVGASAYGPRRSEEARSIAQQDNRDQDDDSLGELAEATIHRDQVNEINRHPNDEDEDQREDENIHAGKLAHRIGSGG